MGRSVQFRALRLAAAATGVVVIASGIAAVPASASWSGLRVSGAMVPALAAAPSAGEGLESEMVPEMSTATSTTRLLANGEYEMNVFSQRVNYLDESGELAPIDTDLVQPEEELGPEEAPVDVQAGDFAAQNAAGLATVLVPEDPATAPAVVSVDPNAEDFDLSRDSGAGDGSDATPDQQWVSVKMQGLTGAPTVEGDTATYDEVEGADAVELTSTVDGLKEVVFLNTPPASAGDSIGAPGRDEQGRLAFRYRIAASEGLVPRETPHGDIEFIPTASDGGDSTPVFVIPRGNMFDSAETVMVGDAEAEGPAYTNDVDYDLTPATPDVEAGDAQGVGDSADGGWDLIVRPNMDWLAAAERVYPVMLDPTLRTFAPQRDCALFQDAPTTNRCGDNQRFLRAGKLTGGTGIADRRRAIFHFNISGLRDDATITNANLQLHMAPNQTEPTQEAAYVVQKTGQAFTNAATWQSPRGGSTTWFGGGATGPEMGLTRLSGNGNPGAHWRYFRVTQAAEDWHAGRPNNGLVLKQRNENIRSEVAFRSTSTQNEASLRPRLNVNFTVPGESDPTLGGERDFWQYEDRELNDRMTAKVNIGNGNLLLENQDASVAGRAGWDMASTRYYNSVAHTQGGSALGAGWSHGFGGPGSVRLEFPNNDGGGERSKVAFWGPSGYRAVFERDGATEYTREKPGIKAHLDFQANENRYELKWFDESKYYFDRTGQLISTQDKNDNILRMTYRSDGRLGSVTDTRNRVLFFTYLTAGSTNTGLIETAEIRRPGPSSNPTGGQPMVRWRYGYDRTTGTIAQLKTSQVEYYDNDDTIRNGSGPDTTRDSNATTDGSGGTIGATTTYNYDTRGKLTSVVDARRSRTEFGYDSADTPKLTQMTRVLGQDQPASTTRFTYFPNPDPGPNNTCKRDDAGGDDADADTRTHVDGERSDVEDITRYCVDGNDRVLRTTDARGKKRSSSWSDNSNVEEADLSGTGSGQQMYDYSYDDDDENLEQTESPEGSTTGATYSDDSAHNPAAVSGDDNGGGQGGSNSWRYRYDDNDNLIRARSGEDLLRPGRDDLNITYEYCWTGDGQISRIMPGDGDGNAGNDDSDNRVCNPGSQGDDTIFTYNGAGELTNVNRPAGGDQTFTYDNLSRIATVTDGKGVTTSYVYDAMDRVVEARHIDNPDNPNPNADPEQTVTWKYDTAGNITTMTNIVNTDVPSTPIPSKTFTYDALNRLKKESPQNPSNETTYDYDPAGNVVKIEVAAERQAGLDATVYTYNPVNNVASINDQRPGDATVTFAYDDRDNRTETIFPIVNADGTTSPNSLVHKAAFNDDSNPTCMWSYRQSSNNPSGDCNAVKRHNRLITYRGYDYKNPDLENLPSTDKDDRVTSTKYQQIDLGDRTTRFTYDAIKRLEQATTHDGDTTGDTIIRKFDYKYSNRSNMTEMNVSTNLGTTPPGLETGRWQYAYNNGDEICSSIRGQANAPGLGCDRDSGPAGRTVYAHDGTGNMLTAEQQGTGADAPLDGLKLEYNLPRQTTEITPPGGATSATSGPQAYDGVEQDRRTAAGNTTMSYGYAGQVTAQSAAATGGAAAVGQIFVRDPAGDLVAMLSRNPASPGTITDVDYYLLDDQNSVMATHDGRGNLTGDGLIRHLYEPYGDTIRTWTQPTAGSPNANGGNPGDNSLATASAPAVDNNPFTYVSGYHDRTTGLIKFGTRYYIPSLATWTQRDPKSGDLGSPTKLNAYNYVGSNPTNRVDVSGRDWGDFVKGYLRFTGIVGGTTALFGAVGAVGGCAVGGIATAGVGCPAGAAALGVPSLVVGSAVGLTLATVDLALGQPS